MTVDDDFLDRVEAVLIEVRAALPEQRDALIQRRCGSDDDLRHEVEAMLRAERNVDDDFLRHSALDSLHNHAGAPIRRVGPWTIEEQIGVGGMGAVFRGQRADGAFEQEVAIKFIRHAYVDPSLEQRFLRERRILASLDHPNIAGLLDGGVTDQGQPYLVMEFIRGHSLLESCDGRRATINERLDIFDTICSAVQHAHAKLVVHRDLKPVNILVDDEGRPRLLDFGIARLVDDETGHAGTITVAAERRFTPQYAAPEQVRGGPVTVAADVYALGMILYELLAGCRPYEVSGSSSAEDTRLICDTTPPTPSRRVESIDHSGTTDIASAARARGTDPVRLRRRLRGDLDQIIMTALRKEPERRYATVEALREDLRRYRDGRPIHARPDHWSYRTSRFIARNRVLVGAAAAVLIALTAGVIATSWQARVAERNARSAERALSVSERVQAFLRSVFTAPDPREGGQDLTMREALDLGAARIGSELGDDPDVEALVREAIGATYRTLGAQDAAEMQLLRANELAAEAFPADDPARASITHELAILRYDQGHFEEAEALAREAYLVRSEVVGRLHNGTLQSENLLALTLEQLNREEEALDHIAHVAGAREHTLGAEHPATLEALNNLADILTTLERYDEALPLMEQVYDAQVAALGPDHPDTLITANDLGTVFGRLDRWEEALGWQQRALSGLEQQFPPGTIDVAIPRRNVAQCLARLGRDQEAVELLTLALDDAVPALGDDHYVIAVIRLARGQSLIALDRRDDALRDLRAAHPVLLAAFGPDHRLTREAATALDDRETAGNPDS